MKKLMFLGLLSLALVACAGKTPQQMSATTMLAMHDLVVTSATVADALCDQKVIPAADCAKIKIGYDDFRKAWPIADDALLVYLKAPATDSGAATAFNVANAIFLKNYAQLIDLFAATGVLKEAK